MNDLPVSDGRPDAPAQADGTIAPVAVEPSDSEPELTTDEAPERVPGRIARGGASLASVWASVRPRTRRGAILGVAAVAALSGALSIVFIVGTGVVASIYGEFGFHPETDAARWAAHQPAFGEAALCASCHEPEYAKATTASHAGIGCETCHGPLLAHADARAEGATDDGVVDGARSASADAAAPIEARLAVPTDEVCIRCHVQAVGRPAGFRQIVPADHYEPVCLQCHDPHTGISRRPPVVQHPLTDQMPPCVTCHGPEGFKARDQRHPDVGSDDAACLACHLPGRGPEEEASR